MNKVVDGKTVNTAVGGYAKLFKMADKSARLQRSVLMVMARDGTVTKHIDYLPPEDLAEDGAFVTESQRGKFWPAERAENI